MQLKGLTKYPLSINAALGLTPHDPHLRAYASSIICASWDAPGTSLRGGSAENHTRPHRHSFRVRASLAPLSPPDVFSTSSASETTKQAPANGRGRALDVDPIHRPASGPNPRQRASPLDSLISHPHEQTARPTEYAPSIQGLRIRSFLLLQQIDTVSEQRMKAPAVEHTASGLRIELPRVGFTAGHGTFWVGLTFFCGVVLLGGIFLFAALAQGSAAKAGIERLWVPGVVFGAFFIASGLITVAGLRMATHTAILEVKDGSLLRSASAD